MISLWHIEAFFTSPQFYVILTVVAAAVVAAVARPSGNRPVVERLLAGDLSEDTDSPGPCITLRVLDTGAIALTRHGVEGVGDDGAVSLAVSVKNHDVTIEERIVPGRAKSPFTAVLDGQRATRADFLLDFLPYGRYHILYNSQPTGQFAAFPFTHRPSMQVTKTLSH